MNPLNRLRALIPEPRLCYGTVVAVDDAGAIIEQPDGAQVRVRGSAAIDDTVFFRNGIIEGPAPGGLVYTPQTV